MFGFLKKKEGDKPSTTPDGARPGWAGRLKSGLARTRAQLGGSLSTLFSRAKIDDELLEELEATL